MAQKYVRELGPFKCYFECGAALADKFDLRSSQHWNWFTGYADKTVHVCPQCDRRHRSIVEDLKAWTEQRPDDFPRQRVHVPPLNEFVARLQLKNGNAAMDLAWQQRKLSTLNLGYEVELAGAQSLRDSMHDSNFAARARDCFRAMAAKIDESSPTPQV